MLSCLWSRTSIPLQELVRICHLPLPPQTGKKEQTKLTPLTGLGNEGQGRNAHVDGERPRITAPFCAVNAQGLVDASAWINVTTLTLGWMLLVRPEAILPMENGLHIETLRRSWALLLGRASMEAGVWPAHCTQT